MGHGVKLEQGPQDEGPQDPGTWDPGLPLKFKSGTRDSPKVKSGTPGCESKFESGTAGTPSICKNRTQLIFLHCFTYYILDKCKSYIYEKLKIFFKEIIFHDILVIFK